jgi:beta-glucanase (GH16 family)
MRNACGRFINGLAMALLMSNVAAAHLPDVPGWSVIWQDEFDGTAVDTAKWVPLDRRDSFNNERQYYHPNQVTVADGNLQLTAINVPRQGKTYQSGLVTSKIPFGLKQPDTNYTALRVEARIMLPTSRGMWPAFWMNPNELIGWPKGGEIDILENKGHEPNRVSSAYHWQATDLQCCNHHRFVSRNHGYSGPESGNFHNTFHTYAVEWEPTQLRFYVDGVLYHTVNEQSASPPESQFNRPIFEFPKYIILNVAVGGDFLGDQQPDATTVFPQTMLVDYVRVWRPQTGVPGDYNGDGVVDAADYTIWRNSQGQSGIGLPADGSGNGTVGPEDYEIWKANYSGELPEGADGASHATPEPTSAVPFSMGLFMLYAQRGWLTAAGVRTV